MAENIDWEFIASLEGKGVTTGYVPDASGSKSGVTIATGFDLGQRNETDLTNLGLSADLITKFKPYLGKKGQDAVDFLAKNPLTITDDEAKDIDNKVRAKKVPALKTKYLNSPHNTGNVQFDDLPSQAQTVIASVSFQYGDLSTKTPKFWKAASSQDWVESVKILRNFGDSYRTRRNKEADLLDQVNKFAESFWEVFRWNLIWYLWIFALIPTLACGTGFGKTQNYIFDEKLANAYKNYEISATEKKNEIAFESGAKAKNCSEYWREKEKSSIKEDIANMLYQSEYLICDALQILKKADMKYDNIVQNSSADKFVQEIYSRLDLTSFPSSLAQTETSDSLTFGNAKEKLQGKIEKNAINSNTKDWNFVLTIAAAADLNKNGKEDLLVWVTDEAKEGNYRAYSTILIYDFEEKGILKGQIQ